MNCRELGPILGSLRDGSLPPAEEDQALAHLESCATCRGAQSRLGSLERLLGAGLPVPDPGEAYFKGQRERLLRSAAPAELHRPRLARFVWAAAAAILILAAGAAYYRGVPARAPQAAPGAELPVRSERPQPTAPPPLRPDEGIPAPAPTARKPEVPEAAPGPLAVPPPEIPPVAPSPGPVAKARPEAPAGLAAGAAARLAALTEEAVDIGLAETPRERVVALFGAAEARLGELGQMMRQDPGLATELAGAYLLLLGEGVKSVLADGSESPQELALARRAAREFARGHERTLSELGAVAQGKLKGTLEEALAMSRELARP